MANIDVMYSSKTDQWATPDDFFRELDQEFHFNLDPCANEQNHKCEKYFTKEDNGLSKDWGGIACFAILRMVERLQTGLKRHCSTLEGLLRGVRRRKVQHFCKGLQTERQAICTAEGEPRHINVSDSDTGKETA